MLIRAGYDIAFECTADTPMLAMLHVRPERHGDLQTTENFAVTPNVPYRIYRDGFGNVCTRLVAPAGVTRFTCDFLIRDSGWPERAPEGARQIPVDELPEEAIVFLLGSRYCETDKLTSLAWSYFGHLEPGWPCVQAISKYAHDRILFDYKQARSDRSAADANYERVGVCRDYAHLAIALCRCMTIPARYCTGYLGDIGVPYDPNPMDFSAWFDVYLGGSWHSWDARHNKPRIGRILMARGRDATDAAITTAFGAAKLVNFEVRTDEVPG
ncbi:MAG TPA: transglutaminase family protein [Rhizomicrobium sp.]